jgi:hypothetical protein
MLVPHDSALVCQTKFNFRFVVFIGGMSGMKLICDKVNNESRQVISHLYMGVERCLRNRKLLSEITCY